MSPRVAAQLLLTITVATAGTVSHAAAQPQASSVGISGAYSRGAELGIGSGVEMNLRVQPRPLRWMSFAARVSATSFGTTTLATSSEVFFADGPAIISEYDVRASVVSAVIGPEFARVFGRSRAYLHVLAGASEVMSRGAFARTYPRGGTFLYETTSPFDLEERSEIVPTVVLGTGLRRRLLGDFFADLGASRTIAGAATWKTEGLFSLSSRPVPPVYDFRRSASMWSWRAGISYAP